jgi:hypothetical protein
MAASTAVAKDFSFQRYAKKNIPENIIHPLLDCSQ